MPVFEIADWRPVTEAPRDGTRILLAVSPHRKFDLEGYVAIGRWISPTLDQAKSVGKLGRQLFDKYGGWWSSGKGLKPFGRPVWGWMPVPEFDFDAHQAALAEFPNGR